MEKKDQKQKNGLLKPGAKGIVVDDVLVEKLLQEHGQKPDALLQILLELHKLVGYISENAVYQISEGLGMPPSDIFSMITYYPIFKIAPVSKYKIHVCLGTTCFLRGSSLLLEQLSKELGIKPGDTTPDGKFSLEVVRCLGACALGPVVMVNELIYPGVETHHIANILNDCV